MVEKQGASRKRGPITVPLHISDVRRGPLFPHPHPNSIYPNPMHPSDMSLSTTPSSIDAAYPPMADAIPVVEPDVVVGAQPASSTPPPVATSTTYTIPAPSTTTTTTTYTIPPPGAPMPPVNISNLGRYELLSSSVIPTLHISCGCLVTRRHSFALSDSGQRLVRPLIFHAPFPLIIAGRPSLCSARIASRTPAPSRRTRSTASPSVCLSSCCSSFGRSVGCLSFCRNARTRGILAPHAGGSSARPPPATIAANEVPWFRPRWLGGLDRRDITVCYNGTTGHQASVVFLFNICPARRTSPALLNLHVE
jgi:hypothetical protein